MTLNDAEFDAVLALSHELPGVEFKGSGDRADRSFFARVVRAMLGMANRRGGGIVVLGVDDTSTGLRSSGVDPALLPGWNHDDVTAAAAPYADPNITLSVTTHVRSGASYVVIQVAEFERVPVLCGRQYDDRGATTILRKGALYVRSRSLPATTEVANHAELRDVLDVAVEKGVREFLATAERAGISVSSGTGFDTQMSGWDD